MGFSAATQFDYFYDALAKRYPGIADANGTTTNFQFMNTPMSASWITGTELDVLIYRLYALPMLAGFTILIAMIAKRISGTWWAGSVAAAMIFLLSALSPYAWTQVAYFDLAILEPNLWTSPTQTFAAVLFAAAVLVVASRLRGDASGRGPWVLATLLLAAVMGAKYRLRYPAPWASSLRRGAHNT